MCCFIIHTNKPLETGVSMWLQSNMRGYCESNSNKWKENAFKKKKSSITIDVNSDKRTLHRCDAFLPAFLLSQVLPFMSMPGLFPWSWDALSDAPSLISRWAVWKKLPERLLGDSGPEGTSHDRRSIGCCTNVSAAGNIAQKERWWHLFDEQGRSDAPHLAPGRAAAAAAVAPPDGSLRNGNWKKGGANIKGASPRQGARSPLSSLLFSSDLRRVHASLLWGACVCTLPEAH